jgi:hypothetical protein
MGRWQCTKFGAALGFLIYSLGLYWSTVGGQIWAVWLMRVMYLLPMKVVNVLNLSVGCLSPDPSAPEPAFGHVLVAIGLIGSIFQWALLGFFVDLFKRKQTPAHAAVVNDV